MSETNSFRFFILELVIENRYINKHISPIGEESDGQETSYAESNTRPSPAKEWFQIRKNHSEINSPFFCPICHICRSETRPDSFISRHFYRSTKQGTTRDNRQNNSVFIKSLLKLWPFIIVLLTRSTHS